MINESLADFPRTHVLTTVTGQHPIARSTYNTRLHKSFEGKTPSQNVLRQSCINHFYRLYTEPTSKRGS
jgi:hypothetical protein